MGITHCCGPRTLPPTSPSDLKEEPKPSLDGQLENQQFAFPNGCIFKEDETIKYFVKNWQLKHQVTYHS